MMKGDNLFSIVVQRRLQAGQVGLHYRSKDAANNALAALPLLTARKIIEDDFGNKVSFDPEDIGNVCLVDIAQSMEQQVAQAEITEAAKAEFVEKARLAAFGKGRIITPGAGGIV